MYKENDLVVLELLKYAKEEVTADISNNCSPFTPFFGCFPLFFIN